jgi:hypothetical protein
MKRISFLLMKWHQIDGMKNWTNYDIKRENQKSMLIRECAM